jgi:energy-coupling factor transporter ATP-binding protein EcfA2
MTNRIEKLTLCGFRGATCPVEIIFNAKKPIVMIFGENGNGKSTIVDAIDFVCNQKYGSINDRSSTLPKSHLPALGQTAKDVSVELGYGGQTWKTIIGTKGPITSGPENRPAAIILRRHQVLSVVNEQPKERYNALQRFITVTNIEKAEQSLREA